MFIKKNTIAGAAATPTVSTQNQAAHKAEEVAQASKPSTGAPSSNQPFNPANITAV
jgi:hypothetical protein